MPTQVQRLLFSVVFVIAAFLTQSVATAQERIVGGTDAPNGEYPWMTALVVAGASPVNGQFCGGSLIASTWVLTAAHCVESVDPSTIDVVINRASLAGVGGERIGVVRIIGHPDYYDNEDAHDLALLELSQPSTVTPVDLVVPRSGFERNHRVATTLGWGQTSFGGAGTINLKEVDVPIYLHQACASAYSLIGLTIVKDNHICAGYLNGGRDSCGGDSGGPLFVEDQSTLLPRLIGVVSFGEECALPEFPGVYARLSTRLEWVNRQIAGTATANETSDLYPRRARLDSACFGLRCTLDARRSLSGPEPAIDFAWEIDSEQLLSGPVIEYDFSAAGDYPVTLTMTLDDGTTRMETREISVDTSRRNDFKRLTRVYAQPLTPFDNDTLIFPVSKPQIGMWHYSGNVTAEVTVPLNSDFDLAVERYNVVTQGWEVIGTSSNAGSSPESVTERVLSGYFRYVITRVSGFGQATLTLDARRPLTVR